MTTVLDLNCDVAEGFGAWRIADDDALLTVVTGANIACGFHAGDPSAMRRACLNAVRHGVAIGAHVGYRDLAGFGRRYIDVDPAELTDDVLYQLGALSAFAAAAGGRVGYVKPHGALYGAIGSDDGQAGAVVSAVRQFDPALPVLGMPGSRWLALAAEAGLPTVAEAFADRAYTPDGLLLPRRSPGAVLTDPAEVASRVVRLATDGEVEATDGTVLAMRARSVCVHGDTPGAVELARAARAALVGAGVSVRSFV
ncbi:MAG: 5-oxoprolinase subunit PxpA [Actinophytocola sp.]|uniref:5-oxoprolinase subunit PxpA n=1 Tax=Actinophytocola sp. TaxID=1872138 RepID=UPI003D6C1B48